MNRRVKDWLLVPDEQMRRRDRVVLGAFRAVLAGLLVKVPALLVLPFLLGTAAREGDLGDVGVMALLVLGLLAPVYLLPYAIYQTGGLRIDADRDVLVVYTLWRRLEVDLAKLDRVTAWASTGQGAWGRISGPGTGSVWLSWTFFGGATSDRVRALLMTLAQRPGVRVNDAARFALDLPDAPSGVRAVLQWSRDFGVILVFGMTIALLAIGYGQILFGTPPWELP